MKPPLRRIIGSLAGLSLRCEEAVCHMMMVVRFSAILGDVLGE